MSTSETRPSAMASSSLRAPPPPPLISLNSEFTTSPNGISRSSTSTSIHRNRPHSDSVSSRNSTVHFDLDDQAQSPTAKPSPSRSSSKSSLKPVHPVGSGIGPGSANMVNGNSYQPVHPSTLHNSTVPSPPKSAPLLSTNSSSSSFMKPFPTDSPTSARPGLPKNRSSQDRRVWSETLPPSSRHRSGSMIAHGKRASRVTGGFETSSDSDGDESTTDQSTKDTGTGTGGNTPYQSENATAGPSRPRAKSLLGPTGRERQNSDASGTSRDLKRRKEKEKEKDEHKRPKKRSSKEPLPPSRMLSYRTTASPPKITPQLPNSKSDSYFGVQNGSSPRSSRMSTARSSPLIESTIPAPNGKSQISRGRSLEMLKERSSSPEGSKRSKGKEREISKKTGDLAASLGLGIGGVQDMALNSEQLRNLLSDSDVSSALRLMNSPHAPASRPANLNEWSNSVFFSPPSTRPTTPGAEQPTHRSPYLVSAPPALTSSDNHGRERTMSVASTVAPPTRSTWGSSPRQRQSIDSHPSPDMQALHRRRASSKAGMMSDGQGGHVPFTHHLPVPSVDEGSPEQELDDVSDGLPAITENDSTALASIGPTVSDKSSKEGKEKEKKSRLSNIFHIGKKKTPEAPIKHDHNLLHKDHRTDKQKEEDKAREKEKYERDVERRRLEQERRDEELAQERRFRALTQVAAHPSAERLAYTEGARLRAFYSHVYEGIDDPPKLNPLAVIRWRIKTEEQTEARLRWEQEQQHDYQHSNKSDTSGFTNHASPHSLTRANHFGGTIHTSPMSVGSSSRYGPRKSVESNRSVSLGSLRKSTEKKGHDDKRRYERGWGYSVDDIVNYKAAKGQVNYFIPPRRSHPDVEVLTEDEDGAFCPRPDTSGHNGRSGSRKDDQSSIADSSKKSHRHRMGVKTASNASLMDVEGIIGDDNVPLTRSTSIETNGHLGVPPKRRLTHRTHQSLSAVGPTSLTQALKQPFEKLSNVAKKQRNHGPSRDEGETQHIEDTKPRTYNHNRSDSAPSPHVMSDTYNHHHTPMSNKPSRTTVNSSLGRNKDNNGLFRRHGTPGAAAGEFTDEEYSKDKEFHLRKLFLKGQRVLSSFDDHTYKLYRRSEASLATNSNGKARQDEREQELLALEAALLRESAFRERQAEVDRKTQLEIEARERIRKLEGEIYAERVEHLDAARQKLENVNANISSVDDAIRQYLFQIDFVRDEASIAANIELDWTGIDPLRAIYGNIGRPKPTEDDEHRDTLPPLRSFTTSHDSGSDLAHAHAHRQRTNSMNNRKSRSQSALVPRRKGSLNASLAPIHSNLNHPLRHRPRRTYLDPTGTERVDPIKQAELVISFAKDRMQDMGKEKQRTRDELENLIYKIELMIKRKDHVRRWTRETLEKNLAKQSQLDQLVRLDRSNDGLTSLLNLIVWRDNSINVVAQSVGAILRVSFWSYYQLKGEVWFCVKWLKPSSYWCKKKKKSTDKSPSPIDGQDKGDGNDNNILDDFGTASPSGKQHSLVSSSSSFSTDSDRFAIPAEPADGQDQRWPFVMPISILILLAGIGLYQYSRA